MGWFNKSPSKEKYLTVCICVMLSSCDSWGDTWGQLWPQTLWEAQEAFASVLVYQSNIWQVTMPEALQHQGGTCKSQLALKKKTRNEPSGQQVTSCCFSHVLQGSERALPTMPIHCGQIQIGNVVHVWTCPAVSSWHLAVGMLQALGRRSDGCSAATPSHVPALHCWAPAGAGPAPAERVDLIPSCDTGSLCSPAEWHLPPLPPPPVFVHCGWWAPAAALESTAV